MRPLKILLAVLFIGVVTVLVARSCIQSPRKHTPYTLGGAKPIAKKIVKTPRAKASALPLTLPTSAAIKAPRTGKMAIVLDDWGQNYPLLQQAIEIDRPLTLAILPHLPKSEQIAEEAYAHKLGVMLHMPMEPFNLTEGLEPNTLSVTMKEEDLRRYLDEALASVPHVEGVNNHMGSRATSDLRLMRVVVGYLKSKNLFFMDSNVTPKTVAHKAALEAGIRFTKRDVFIDNESELSSIRQQLLYAKRIALATGRVVVIGHDKKNTLQVIKEMVPELEREGIQFVLVKELVR